MKEHECNSKSLPRICLHKAKSERLSISGYLETKLKRGRDGRRWEECGLGYECCVVEIVVHG